MDRLSSFITNNCYSLCNHSILFVIDIKRFAEKQEQIKESSTGSRQSMAGDRPSTPPRRVRTCTTILRDDPQLFHGCDADTINKATCLTMILVASDTTTVTLTWALTLLLNHRNILRKAPNELDTQVGLERQVNESDIKNLVYLQAILKETMRLYPAAPLSLPHESTEDCTVSGYYILAQTQLLVNLWKIQCDPAVWSDSCEFQPERFLTTHKDFDVMGQNFEYLPFGSGRRMCPGVLFALQVLQLTLGSLLHGFDLETQSNEEEMDTSEGIGLTFVKATPIQLILSPRLSPSLYA